MTKEIDKELADIDSKLVELQGTMEILAAFKLIELSHFGGKLTVREAVNRVREAARTGDHSILMKDPGKAEPAKPLS